jgi:hypothetical protein
MDGPENFNEAYAHLPASRVWVPAGPGDVLNDAAGASGLYALPSSLNAQVLRDVDGCSMFLPPKAQLYGEMNQLGANQTRYFLRIYYPMQEGAFTGPMLVLFNPENNIVLYENQVGPYEFSQCIPKIVYAYFQNHVPNKVRGKVQIRLTYGVTNEQFFSFAAQLHLLSREVSPDFPTRENAALWNPQGTLPFFAIVPFLQRNILDGFDRIRTSVDNPFGERYNDYTPASIQHIDITMLLARA